MAFWSLFLIAVGLTGVVSNRSARILNRSVSANDIENGTQNVSVVLGTNLSACNSTLCGVSKLRRVRLKPELNFTAAAVRRNDGFRQPSRGLLPPYQSVRNLGEDQRGYSIVKPQQDTPSNGYSYPNPQEDSPGYNYPKPQQDDPTNGYEYPKPKPQQDELTSGYSYPKPQQDDPADGYSYQKPKPQQDESSNGYSYPKPKPQQNDPADGYSYPKLKPQQDELSNGYSYPKPKPQLDDPAYGYSYPKPKPQQDDPLNGYSYPKPKPQQDEPTDGYSYPKPKPQQDELPNGYSYPKPKPQIDDPAYGYSYPKPNPQQDDPLNGYSYPKPKPQQDDPADGYYPKPKPKQNDPTNGYSYSKPKPQQDDPAKGYIYPKPKPQEDEPEAGYSYPKPQQTFADALLDDYSKRYQPGSSNRDINRKKAQNSVSATSWNYSTKAEINSWRPMVSGHRAHEINWFALQQTTGPPLQDEAIDIPVPKTDSSEDTPEDSLIPPGRDEPPWKLYGTPSGEQNLQNSHGSPQNDDAPQATYGPPKPLPIRPPENDRHPQNDPADSYHPQEDLQPPPAVYGTPVQQTTSLPQEDPVDSYLPPQHDPQPPRPLYGFPKPHPPQDNPTDSYIPPQNDYQTLKPTHGPPQPTRPPQKVPSNSYLTQNDPLPQPTYGPPARPTRLPQNDPADSYLPPQNDPLPPQPTYGPPARPTRPPHNSPADSSYVPPQNDPLPPKPTYGPPARPIRPPQNDPLPPQPTYGPPARPTRPPIIDLADSYLPLQNDPLPTYGPPARPTRPTQNDPLPPRPTYGPPARPTRPPQNDVADSYLPPQDDIQTPKPIYGAPTRPTRPPQNDQINSYLPPQNDPLPSYGPPARPTRPQNDPPPVPVYGPPSRPTEPPQEDPADSYLPPQNDPKPPSQSYGIPQEPTTPSASEDTQSSPYWPEVEENRSLRGSNGDYLSPPSLAAPSGSFDDPPSPVYVPYHFQEETDAGRQANLPLDGNRANQNRVLRVPGGLQPSDIHVTDLRCWRSAPSSVFAFTLWTTRKMAAPPVLVSAESSSVCRLRGDPTAPRTRYLVRLSHTDLSRCGVRPCTNNGEERMCVTLQLPQLTGIRLASDPQLEISCAPPPPSDWSLKQLRMAAAAPPLGPPELRVRGGRSPLHTQLQLYRRSAPGATWRRIESSQAVVLGEELQLRALVRAGDGWQSSKLGDVMVRRTNTGEDLKSTATLSDSTSAISARLVTPEGCPNPDMEDVTGLQSWLAGDPLVSMLPIRVFMFRGQKDGEQIVINARVTACMDRLHCKMEPRQCEAANAATRVKRSVSNEGQKNETKSSEAEISLRVILPPSGPGTGRYIPKQRGSLLFTTTKLISCVLASALISILVVVVLLLYRRGLSCFEEGIRSERTRSGVSNRGYATTVRNG